MLRQSINQNLAETVVVKETQSLTKVSGVDPVTSSHWALVVPPEKFKDEILSLRQWKKTKQVSMVEGHQKIIIELDNSTANHNEQHLTVQRHHKVFADRTQSNIFYESCAINFHNLWSRIWWHKWFQTVTQKYFLSRWFQSFKNTSTRKEKHRVRRWNDRKMFKVLNSWNLRRKIKKMLKSGKWKLHNEKLRAKLKRKIIKHRTQPPINIECSAQIRLKPLLFNHHIVSYEA